MAARIGRKPKWTEERSSFTLRLPKSHREVYEQKARERGLSLNDYLVITMAEMHGLEVPTWIDPEEQLPLTA